MPYARPMLMPIVCALSIAGIAMLLGACASTSPGTTPAQVEPVFEVEVAAEQYVQTFQAVRDTLREQRFVLDRIDAPLGVLTTLPKPGVGYARPWEGPTDSPMQDIAQQQRRVVRVTFRPPGSTISRSLDDPSINLVDQTTTTIMRVDAIVERVERPGKRPQFDAVRMTSQSIAPELEARGMTPAYIVPIRRDNVLASYLLGQITERAGLIPEP